MRRQSQGFSLIEVLIAIAVLGVVAMALLSFFSSANFYSSTGKSTQKADMAGQSVLEELNACSNFEEIETNLTATGSAWKLEKLATQESKKSVLRKDSYFSSLFSNIQSSNNSPVYARYERRGGVKMGKNKDVYIESIVAHKLKNGSGQSGAVRYIRNKSTNGTFYFEYINTTSKTLEYILVEYDKKNNYWSIPLNYTNGDKEIVLTIPANSEISLENIVFKNNPRKEYYLVAIEENLQFSWRNLLKELNNSLVRPVNGDCESALYIFTDK